MSFYLKEFVAILNPPRARAPVGRGGSKIYRLRSIRAIVDLLSQWDHRPLVQKGSVDLLGNCNNSHLLE